MKKKKKKQYPKPVERCDKYSDLNPYDLNVVAKLKREKDVGHEGGAK